VPLPDVPTTDDARQRWIDELHRLGCTRARLA
jgi:hypothetical protein